MISTWSGQFLTLGFVCKKCANSSVEFCSEWLSFPSVFALCCCGPDFARHPRLGRSFRFAVCAEFGKVDILVNSAGIMRRTPSLRPERQRLECDAGDQPEGHTAVRILDAT